MSNHRTAEILTINCNDCNARITFRNVHAEKKQDAPLRFIVRCDSCQSKMEIFMGPATDKAVFLKGATLLETRDPANPEVWRVLLRTHGLKGLDTN